jgi:hypothetical protein
VPVYYYSDYFFFYETYPNSYYRIEYALYEPHIIRYHYSNYFFSYILAKYKYPRGSARE